MKDAATHIELTIPIRQTHGQVFQPGKLLRPYAVEHGMGSLHRVLEVDVRGGVATYRCELVEDGKGSGGAYLYLET